MAAPAAEQADRQSAAEREDAEAKERAHPYQAGTGGAGEGPVGDRVRGERRAAQDREEAHDSRDDRDDARDLPGVDHETGEHVVRS